VRKALILVELQKASRRGVRQGARVERFGGLSRNRHTPSEVSRKSALATSIRPATAIAPMSYCAGRCSHPIFDPVATPFLDAPFSVKAPWA